MNARTVALFGGSMNPPGLHHRAMAEALARRFDAVKVVPCGPRPDKARTEEVPSVHRAAMSDLGFRALPRVTVHLDDLERPTFTRSHALEALYAHEGDLWHAVSDDKLRGGRDGASEIHTAWEKGPEVWSSLRWAVCHTPEEPPDPRDLPPRCVLVPCARVGTSADIRERAFKGEALGALVTPAVAAFIARRGLYRGGARPLRAAPLDASRPCVLHDTRNPRAAAFAEVLQERYPCVPSPDHDPSVLLVLGGDGTMLHAIRAHWRRRVPFFGVNFGHLGFLLNGLDDLHGALPEEALHRELPLLRVDTTAPDGTRASHLAFNDAWVERESGQTAWVEVRVNDQVRLARAVCDGILLSTAAGSTSYARAMGVAPLQVDTALLTLAGSNVMSPEGWRQAHLPLDARVEFRGLDPDKRPLRGFVDGAPCGPVAHMAHAVSRVAAVELAFSPGHDIAHKLTRIQFPALARET